MTIILVQEHLQVSKKEVGHFVLQKRKQSHLLEAEERDESKNREGKAEEFIYSQGIIHPRA